MTDWQPIDTAPEHKRILLFYPAQRGLGNSMHICDEWAAVSVTRTYFIPTHWMELPDPPRPPQDTRGTESE